MSVGDSAQDTAPEAMPEDGAADIAGPDAADEGALPDSPLPPDAVLDLPVPQDTVDLLLPDQLPDPGPDQPEQVDAVPDVLLPDVPAGKSCHDIADCALAVGCSLGNEACWDACAFDATAAAMAKYEELKECYKAKCPQGPEENEDCAWEQCGGLVVKCIAGEGNATCAEVFDCATGCPQDDGTCMLECFAQASEETAEKIAEIFSIPEGPEQFPLIAQCVGGEGTADCADTLTCMQTCGEDPNGSCTFGCLKLASPEAVEEVSQMMTCGQDPCWDKLVVCLGGQGTGTCKQALQCMGGCGQDSSGQCFLGCVKNTSPEAAQQLIDVMGCIKEECPDPENCPVGWMTCSLKCKS
jgi:hypothetical protein